MSSMVRSMTGFARHEQQGPWGRLVWELRAVNSRYFDLQLKLPDEFRALENDLRAYAASRIARGKVEANLRFSPEASAPGGELALDRQRLQTLKTAMEVVTSELRITSEPDPLKVLAWPGVLQERTEDAAPRLAAARSGFEQALAEFDAMRMREGARMAEFLQQRLQAMRERVAAVRERWPQARDAWVERLRSRCAELGVEVEPQRLAQEVALAAQKLDVDEEMSRLQAHLDEIAAVLQQSQPMGRRLDFLMQELNREANTLSSKAQDETLTRAAVDMKVLIEQMREQVQNLE